MRNLFSRAGNVKRVSLMRAKKPQECKNYGYGYVCTRIVVLRDGDTLRCFMYQVPATSHRDVLIT